MRASFVLITAGLVAGTGVAFADGDPAGGGGDASGGSAAPAMAPAAPAAAGDWMQLDQRPLVVPMGKLAIDVGVPFLAITTDDGMGNSDTSLGIGAAVGFTYGAADKIEVGANYDFTLKDFDATGVLAAHGAYLALHNDKMDFALAALLDFDLHSSGDLDLDVGAWFRYRLAPKLSLFTGQPPGTPELGGGIVGALATGVGGYQLGINLNNSNSVALAIPVGVGYQATPNVWVFGELELANIAINNGSNEFIFSDFIPITVGAFYSMDKIDIGANFTDDLKNAGDAYAITVAARYWVK